MMKKKLIMCIDDDEDALKALTRALELRGYEVVATTSGEAALEGLKTISPDLIITDLRMSPLNGFEVYVQVRKEQKHASVPFFFITAVDDDLARKYGHALGADAYIEKPVDLDTLDSAIRKKLRLP